MKSEHRLKVFIEIGFYVASIMWAAVLILTILNNQPFTGYRAKYIIALAVLVAQSLALCLIARIERKKDDRKIERPDNES